MAEARNRAEWERTSILLALIFNVNRDPKKSRAKKPADFNPFSKRRPPADQIDDVVPISVLRDVFCRKK